MANKHPIHKFEVTSYTYGIRPITALELKSTLEKYMEPGVLKPDGAGNMVFVPKSFSTEFCAGMLASSQFKDQLPRLNRLLLFPLPIRIGDELVFPKEKYDPRFGTYLVPDAPKIKPMKIETAREWVKWSNFGFCYTSEQSRTHAIARQLTPFGRGILGWTERVPLWFYCANRPRAGKDYLHGVTSIIYTGSASQDNPIGKDAEETAKRITAAGLAGRWFMYFANCQVPLHDQYLIKILTDEEIRTRRLGSNDASADLIIPNEMEFGLSANIGLTYREDLEPRMRKIELAFYEEDENSRTFKHPYLHQEMKEHRADLLSAYAAIYQYWADQGFPKGKTPFTTYPKWAEVIGGVMMANGFGDPCLPWKGAFASGGDLKTSAMKALFIIGYETFGEAWIQKKEIYDLITKKSDAIEELQWFGALEGTDDTKRNKTRLGIWLNTFKGRILDGIELKMDESVLRSQDRKFQFSKAAKGADSSSSTSDTPDTYSTCLPLPRVEKKHTTKEKKKICSDVESGWQQCQLGNVGAKVVAPAGLDFLALDLETYADVVVKGGKKPKIKLSGGALHPWSGDIRLLTVTDIDGNLQQYDLKATPILPAEILSAIGRNPLIIHNAAFDLLFLVAKLGIQPDRIFCTLTASRILSGSRTVKHDLAAVLERYLGVTLAKEHGASDWGTMLLSPEQLEYAEDDVRYLHPLQEKLETDLEAAGLSRIFQMEMDLLPVVVAMEHYGFAVDAVKLKEFRDRMRKEADADAAALRTQLRSPKLNVDSPQQLAEAFNGIGLDLEATNKDILATLDHPLAALVLEYRRKDNLAGKAEGLLKHIRPDGRIHARFNPLGTETGRFTSSKPNIQQVPREAGIRECFVASALDRKLIIADFGQVELRRGAALSQDAVMIQAFKDGKDIHRETGGEVLHKRPEEIKGRDRTLAKAVNFGLLYGQGADGFRRYAKVVYGLDVTLEEAEEMRSLFFKKYKGLARWHQDAWRKAEAGEGEARSVMGRRLLARKDDDWARFNLWTNFLDSGDCADYQKMSTINVARVVPSDVYLVASVHDESIYDVPADRAEELCATIRMVMEDTWYQLFGRQVPIEINAKVCDNWAEKG